MIEKRSLTEVFFMKIVVAEPLGVASEHIKEVCKE